MNRNIIETVMGAVVLVVAALFLFFSYSTAQLRSVDGYTVRAKFDRIDGLALGSDVRISGIKVGTVNDQRLDPETFLAEVSMSIDPSVELPKDSSAEIVSESLLGGKYMAIVPGGDDEVLAEGDEIRFTQSPVSLEQLIGKFMFSPPADEAPSGAAGSTLN